MPSLSLGLVLSALCCVLTASASPLVLKPQVSFPVEYALPPSHPSSFHLNPLLSFYGVDVSQPTSADAFACLKAQNLRYAVVRCYESVGRPDPNCAQTVRNAHAGGMEQVLSALRTRRRLAPTRMQVDAYMFPCPQCGPAAAQVQSLFD